MKKQNKKYFQPGFIHFGGHEVLLNVLLPYGADVTHQARMAVLEYCAKNNIVKVQEIFIESYTEK